MIHGLWLDVTGQGGRTENRGNIKNYLGKDQ